MTTHELDELTRMALNAAERNNKLARHIHAARRHLVLMIAALLLMAVALYFPAGGRPYAPVAIAAFGLGYLVRATLGHMHTAARRRRHAH